MICSYYPSYFSCPDRPPLSRQSEDKLTWSVIGQESDPDKNPHTSNGAGAGVANIKLFKNVRALELELCATSIAGI